MDFKERYQNLVNRLVKTRDIKEAMSLAVGGEFESTGKLERDLLIQYGLRDGHKIIDVGCGSGRLAFQLRDYQIQYSGLDIVPDLINYASNICERPDWRFYKASGLTIDDDDNQSDYVCFFSVFTHLLHEQTYKYLAEAKRVLRPGGFIIFSFLEFQVPSHWSVFENMVARPDSDAIVDQFISRDAIAAWASHLGLNIVEILDGDKPNIKLTEPIILQNGRTMNDYWSLGQSVCVMTK